MNEHGIEHGKGPFVFIVVTTKHVYIFRERLEESSSKIVLD